MMPHINIIRAYMSSKASKHKTPESGFWIFVNSTLVTEWAIKE